MFIGEYKHSMDAKGRLAVPVKFRSKLKRGAVVTKGLDNCLFLYPVERWEEEAKKLADLPVNQSKARAFSRHMLAGAMEIECDNQGRVNLPDYLRNFAHLGKKVIIAGMYDRLEIWNEEAWDEYREGTEENSNEIAEELGEMGI